MLGFGYNAPMSDDAPTPEKPRELIPAYRDTFVHYLFGTPGHEPILLHFLNAVLENDGQQSMRFNLRQWHTICRNKPHFQPYFPNKTTLVTPKPHQFFDLITLFAVPNKVIRF